MGGHTMPCFVTLLAHWLLSAAECKLFAISFATLQQYRWKCVLVFSVLVFVCEV